MPRIPLQRGENLKTIILKLGENNPDALNILKKITLSKMDDVSLMLCLLSLDDMNIRGRQIVAGFKHCNSNIKSFIFAVLIRAEDLIVAINEACPEELAYKSMHERNKFGEKTLEKFDSQYFKNILIAIGPYKVIDIIKDQSITIENTNKIQEIIDFLMVKKAFNEDGKNNGNIPIGKCREMSPVHLCFELEDGLSVYVDLQTGLRVTLISS